MQNLKYFKREGERKYSINLPGAELIVAAIPEELDLETLKDQTTESLKNREFHNLKNIYFFAVENGSPVFLETEDEEELKNYPPHVCCMEFEEVLKMEGPGYLQRMLDKYKGTPDGESIGPYENRQEILDLMEDIQSDNPQHLGNLYGMWEIDGSKMTINYVYPIEE